MRTIAIITAILAGAFTFSTVLPAAGEDKPAVTQTEKDAFKRGKPHSHVEEKTGVPQHKPLFDQIVGRPNPWTETSRHFHPRDK